MSDKCAISITVQPDLSVLNEQVAELNSLLERLPEHVRNGFRDRIANLADFLLEIEDIPACETSTYILRFRSVALAELCASARGALDSGGT